MLDYQFKVSDVPGQSRAADKALAFAISRALPRLALSAHTNVDRVGHPLVTIPGRTPTYSRLMCQPLPLERFQSLRGLNIESEARRQSHRLLREDFDAAYGSECMVQRHLYRALGGCIEPRQPVNTQPRGFARLDEAFEATFNV
jgi:hypothetical protein